MRKQKDLQNFKVFAPKRPFLRPRFADAIKPGETKKFSLGFKVTVENTAKRTIYARFE